MMRQQKQLCAALRAKMAGEAAQLPEGSEPLWRAFRALSRTRGASMAGRLPISYQEIEAWCRLTRTPLEPHHVEIITALDETWLDIAESRRKAPDGVNALPPKPTTQLTPELLDLIT